MQENANEIHCVNDNEKSFDEIISSSRGFKMAFVNINSLTRHFDELLIFMANRKLDALAINETKLDYRSSNDDVNIPGYVCIRKDRDSHGGGVCIYIQQSITYSRKACYEIDELEMIAVDRVKMWQLCQAVSFDYMVSSS